MRNKLCTSLIERAKSEAAEAAVREIREICGLLFNGYGDDIHPVEQITMIRNVLKEYDGVR